MSAVRHFEAERFWVKSATDPTEEYLVDLEELNGIGICACSSKHKRQPSSSCWHKDEARKKLKEMQS